MSLAAHKLHGPKGVGALYLRRGTHLRAQQLGGGQERKLRAGTQNVAGIVGFGVAAELAAANLNVMRERIAPLRDRLETELCQRVPNAHVIGDRDNRLPNTANIAFEALEGESVMLLLSENGIYISSGAACTSGSLEPSHVVRAMGIDPRVAHGATRFSLSRFTTAEEIETAVERIPPLIARLSALSSVTERPAH
jgi:cysteine desulfurase